MCVPRQTETAQMPPCPAWPGERIDGGPHCCDLACVFGDKDQAWHGQEDVGRMARWTGVWSS